MRRGTQIKFNDGTELMTVRKLVTLLMQEDMDSYVAIDQNGYANKTILMTECFKAGDFYMKCKPRIQKEYFLDDELTEEQKRDMIKVLVIGAGISRDEIKSKGDAFHNVIQFKRKKKSNISN